jgi:hypothetical protein
LHTIAVFGRKSYEAMHGRDVLFLSPVHFGEGQALGGSGGVDGLTGGEHVAELDGFGGTGVGPAGAVARAGSDGGRELAGGQELGRGVLLRL